MALLDPCPYLLAIHAAGTQVQGEVVEHGIVYTCVVLIPNILHKQGGDKQDRWADFG